MLQGVQSALDIQPCVPTTSAVGVVVQEVRAILPATRAFAQEKEVILVRTCRVVLVVGGVRVQPQPVAPRAPKPDRVAVLTARASQLPARALPPPVPNFVETEYVAGVKRVTRVPVTAVVARPPLRQAAAAVKHVAMVVAVAVKIVRAVPATVAPARPDRTVATAAVTKVKPVIPALIAAVAPLKRAETASVAPEKRAVVALLTVALAALPKSAATTSVEQVKRVIAARETVALVVAPSLVKSF